MVGHRSLLFLVLLLGYVLYLVIGAYIFSTLEQPYEDELRGQVEDMWADFLKTHPCLSEKLLDDFLRRALLVKSFGVSILRNISVYEMKWDFISSLFFTGTTLTTIGYGHPVPISVTGKLFCLVYCIIGIPFTLSLLSAATQNLLILLRDKPIHILHLHFNISRTKLEWIHGTVLIALLLLLFFFIPAMIFDAVEGNWSYVDTMYFCFISLSTIGLGDYVPGEQIGQRMPALYKLLVIGTLFINCLVAVFLVIEILKNLVKYNKFFSLFILRREEDRRDAETDQALPSDSEIHFSRRSDETTRRRVPHSVSPAEKSYGSINPSFT
ncbi:potassium channel subfamily K member 1-like [Hyperolius riggenbachi]|uniref:potassium channel subfamily K member 1-like n=1 Tax=Hyperolius riggenbachi TaxID=752182 RepID=UPI0035A35F13